VFVDGTAPEFDDGSCPADGGEQATRCLDIIGMALADAGSSSADVVRTRISLIDAADSEAVGRVHGQIFPDIRPANTTVVVAALLDEKWKVEIEVEAIITLERSPMS